MRTSLLLGVALMITASSVRPQSAGASGDAALAHAQKEAAQAAKRLEILERQAAQAGDEAARLRAQQRAAAAAIEAAEAHISAADAQLRLANAKAARAERRLAERRAPLAALLAGLATMGRQPPILALADDGSVDEIVRVRALLDATMPVILRRTAALQAQLAERRNAASNVKRARMELARGRDDLGERKRKFAELEARASGRAATLASQAFGANDRVLASGETLESMRLESARRAEGRAAARDLLKLEFATPRPMRGDSAVAPIDFAYSLPLPSPVIEGLGSVNAAGIASRGVRFDAGRGVMVAAPADGTILFAAPYRSEDGVIIIDHGAGWTSVLLGVASDRPRGTKVRRGEPLGRALGPVSAELRRNGRPVSPAFIAASSTPLSNSGISR